MSITLNELVKGRDKQAPNEYTKAVQANLSVLLEKLNVIRAAYGKPMNISSGWRTLATNESTANAAKKSKHLSGLAADVQDLDGKFWEFCLANLALMQDLGLYLEDKRWTPSWVHLGIGAPTSGKRIFIPSSKPAPAPSLFNGKYDAKFDKI